jgi:cytochrome bd-type quinol oxidase subunit 2
VRPTNTGPGRALVAVYAVFAVAAGARSAVQLATRFEAAPLAYLLSALAAAVYLLATVALARSSRRLAFTACSIELAGVLTVGTASLLAPAAFPDATVWSDYGIGYGFLPLVLPVLGLLWLRRTAWESVA